MRGFRRPPKYSCSSCNRLFKSRKAKDDHILFNRCKGMKAQKLSSNKQIIVELEPELVSLKDEIVHYDPQPTKYYGTPYDYSYPGLATGNRHLRCGAPFLNDPLHRTTLQQNQQKKIALLPWHEPRNYGQ